MTEQADPDRCESCGERIPPAEQHTHADGLDATRPECPRQDLERIAGLERDNPWTKFLHGRG